MSNMYYCSDCNKIFKAGDPGKTIKCPKCTHILKDLKISDDNYALLSSSEKAALKTNTTITEQPKILENEDKLPKISSGVLNVAVDSADKLNKAVISNQEMHSAINNTYMKVQIQSQILAADNFVSICKMSALKNDGVIDAEEAKLLKKIEKITDDYKKALNKLI